MTNQVVKSEDRKGTSLFSHDPFSAFREEMNSLIDRVFGRSGGFFDTPSATPFSVGQITPSVDLHETDKAYSLTAELPGLDEKDVELIVRDGLLTLKGEKRYEKKDEKDEARVVERHYGSFQRIFTLPSDVDDAEIEAKFDKGVLTVTMPKKPGAKPAGRRIAIGKG
ncbi:Hsp20/alpha crystallin family protein [Parvibaculum sp.]|jgi:HSP20 family protein|uniref:Hsp20/alpha crystallin family protein n=1 Tax=Parvibaculum sp. TaxID=2024848 RepID=UPI000C4CCF08|nr:Hsp20/alpha crystallin family protein [Parvibaculum sp.]MAM94649.1 molecular chaperone Hsp20 [Parvibaculum sp.]|tara:strand:+ start:17989 stop:18489 length:501 start_codon:yes stop_codon:yes gene_type:complete